MGRRRLGVLKHLVESPTRRRFQAACIESAVFAHEGGLALEHGDVEPETEAVAGFEEVVGRDRVLRELLGTVRDVAATDSNILLTGETGTGEELVSTAVHTPTPRRGTVNAK